jgi:hypothetical protein
MMQEMIIPFIMTTQGESSVRAAFAALEPVLLEAFGPQPWDKITREDDWAMRGEAWSEVLAVRASREGLMWTLEHRYGGIDRYDGGGYCRLTIRDARRVLLSAHHRQDAWRVEEGAADDMVEALRGACAAARSGGRDVSRV